MRVRVKICGVTTAEGVRAAADAGADAVGFVFAESPRRVAPARATELAGHLPPFVTRVAVFRHPDAGELETVLREFRPDVVQSEPAAHLARACGDGIRLLPVLHDHDDLVDRTLQRPPATALLEAAGRGGRGVVPDWDRATVLARHLALVLAGGLTPDNVAEAIARVRPHAVDVSSGVESAPGIKDPERIARFVEAVRNAEHALAARQR